LTFTTHILAVDLGLTKGLTKGERKVILWVWRSKKKRKQDPLPA